MYSGIRYLLLKPVTARQTFQPDVRQQTSEVGFPIRISADQSLFAAPHGLSQRTTSFIACAYQGIHRTPLSHLIALIINARLPQGPPAKSVPERGTSDILLARPSQTTIRPSAAPGTAMRTISQPYRRADDTAGKTSVTREFSVGRCGQAQPAFARAPLQGRRPKNSSLHDVSKPAANPLLADLLQTRISFDKHVAIVSPDHNGGARRDRTDDLLLAKQALSQLSYGPENGQNWWAWDDSNVRPHPYQGCALTT